MAIHSKRSQEGYLLIDHSNSPGVRPEDVGGQMLPGVGKPGKYESATITCAHCHRQVILNPQRTRDRGYCSNCDHYVCDSPACNKNCTPFQRTLDRMMNLASRFVGREDSGGIVITDRV